MIRFNKKINERNLSQDIEFFDVFVQLRLRLRQPYSIVILWNIKYCDVIAAVLSMADGGEPNSRHTGRFAAPLLWRKIPQYRLLFTIAANPKTAMYICHSGHGAAIW